MPHIRLSDDLPGIRGLLAFRPETAAPLCELVEILLHAPGTLTPAERELIATFVSSQNGCHYCRSSHGAIAAEHLGGDENLVQCVQTDFEHADISDKLKALLTIADQVRRAGRNVSSEDVERARSRGATDQEIHDTVLIAAAFCMFNRYVDGLATWAPTNPDFYRDRAATIARDGYLGIPRDVRSASSPAAKRR